VIAIRENTAFINRSLRIVFLFFLIIVFGTCIDPYNPNIRGIKSLLVVDGQLTNEDLSYTIKLSRSVKTQNEDPVMVTGAYVSIIDQDGIFHTLTERSAGIYKSDSLEFRGEEGKSYILYIKSAEGNEYRSDPATMYPAQPVDTIYYRKDQEIPSDHTAILDGIRIYLDAKNQGGIEHMRWTYDEWWKFSVPTPKLFNYIDQYTIPDVDTVKQVCYSHSSTSDILIHTAEGSQSAVISRMPVLFVASAKSDRLLLQYCIDIRQLTLSPEEYQFWKQLKEINESGGDIFDKQPFTITGNVHGVTHPEETVLGYFQVSAVSEKRIYILPGDIKDFNLPKYSYDCESVEIGPSDYPQDPTHIVTFDKIYDSYTSTGFVFIRPVYDLRLNLVKMVFTKPSCALCTYRGSLKKPWFWTDFESSPNKK
jgi:hypothetical protein